MGSEVVALSCVSVGAGQGGSMPILARVSIVDQRGNVLLDVLVRPTVTIINYRTASTGLHEESFGSASSFATAQTAAQKILEGKTLVGHALWSDLQVLGLSHPAVDTRDMALFLPFRQALSSPNQVVGLPTLVWHFMRRKMTGLADSVESSRAAMDLYRSHSEDWEACIKSQQWPCALPPGQYARCYT